MNLISGAVAEGGAAQASHAGAVADQPTRDLLEAAVESGYAGSPWEELARRLVTGALPALERSIRTGTVYGRCNRAGYPIAARPELQRWPLSEDIAAEAVEECLARFQNQVLPAGEWDPDRGTSLEDFFAACCIPHLANRWRFHQRQLPACAIELDSLDETRLSDVLTQVAHPPPDPAHVVEQRDLLAHTAGPISLDDRWAFVLMEQGWSPMEIAQVLGITRNTLDARISRARKAARARRTQ